MIRRRRHSSLSVSRFSSFYFFSPQVLEVVSQRGRKGTDPKELMQQLQVLSFVGPHLPVPAPAPARLSFAWRRPEVQLNDERYI